MNRLFIILFQTIIIIGTWVVPHNYFHQDYVWILTSLAIISTLIFLSYKETNKEIKEVFLKPNYLLIIAYFIVFFQKPIDFVLGYNDGSYLQVGNIGYVIVSLKYAVIGLCAYYIGYLSFKTNKTYEKKDIKLPVLNPRVYCVLSSLLIVLVLIMVPKSILMGGYNNDMLTNASVYNYLSSWSNTILISYIVQFTINYKQTKKLNNCSIKDFLNKVGLWQNLNALIYSIIILNVGDRGPLIILAFSYYISYIIVSKKKVSRVSIITVLVAGILFTSLLGDTKKYRDNNNIIERISQAFDDQSKEKKESFLPATNQLAGSFCCLPIAVQMIPLHEDYYYGLSILSDLIASIPFIGRIIELPESSSYKISEFALGSFFSFGLGTNCIASLYMDGSIIFIIVGMLVFGILIRKFEICIFSETTSSFIVFCLAFYFLTHVVYIPRSTLFSPFKYGLWMYIIMSVYSYVRNRKLYL